jgi:hypothetical protein
MPHAMPSWIVVPSLNLPKARRDLYPQLVGYAPQAPTGTRMDVQLPSVDRNDFLKKPSLH